MIPAATRRLLNTLEHVFASAASDPLRAAGGWWMVAGTLIDLGCLIALEAAAIRSAQVAVLSMHRCGCFPPRHRRHTMTDGQDNHMPHMTARHPSAHKARLGREASPGLAAASAPHGQVQAQLLELAADAILVRDVGTGRLRYWNRGAEQPYGWSREEAVGQVVDSLLQTQFPRPLEEIEAELVRTGEAGAPVAHLEALESGQPVYPARRLGRDAPAAATSRA